MNIATSIAQALPIAIQVVPAIAAGEITVSGFVRAARKEIGYQKLSSELAAAALYGLACVTPIPYMSAAATAVFVGYSLLKGGREDAYISSKLIYKPCEFVAKNLIYKPIEFAVKKILIPFGEHVVVPVCEFAINKIFIPLRERIIIPAYDFVAKKIILPFCERIIVPFIENVIIPLFEKVIAPVVRNVARAVGKVWNFCRKTISKIVTTVAEIIKPVFKALFTYVVKPLAELAEKFVRAVWNLGESLVRNVLKPVADAIWAVVRSVLKFIGSALARLAFIPEAFFNNPRWTVFAILAAASVAVAIGSAS